MDGFQDIFTVLYFHEISCPVANYDIATSNAQIKRCAIVLILKTTKTFRKSQGQLMLKIMSTNISLYVGGKGHHP